MSPSRPTTPTMRAPRFVTPQNSDDDSSSTSGSPMKRRRSDVEDSDYSPRAEQQVKRAIAEKYTPGKRRKTGSSVATYARENAVNAFQLATNFKLSESALKTLNYYRGEVPCLISRQQREVDCVETCHILPRAVRYDVLDKLEWVWGFNHCTLNVDTRYNLVHLNAALHGAFDRNAWLFLPVEFELLEILHRTTSTPPPKQTIHHIYGGRKTFRYKFVPLPPMEATPVLHYSGDYTTKPGDSDTKLFHYPFDQLPIVESHIYPHYVIFNLGEKLTHFFGNNLEQEPIPGLSFDTFVAQLDSVYAALLTCHKLYKRWIGAVPPTWFIQGKDSDDPTSGQSDIPDDTMRSATGGRSTRSRSKPQADGTGSDDNSGSVPVDHVPTTSKNYTLFVNCPENVVYPTDSISCRDGPFNGDEERNEGGGGSDTDSEFSDASWVNEIETWRTNILIAVEEEERKEENDEGGESMGVVKGTSPKPGSSVGSYSESSTMVDVTVVIGLMLGKPCGNEGSGEWEGADAAEVDSSPRSCRDMVGLSESLIPQHTSLVPPLRTASAVLE